MQGATAQVQRQSVLVDTSIHCLVGEANSKVPRPDVEGAPAPMQLAPVRSLRPQQYSFLLSPNFFDNFDTTNHSTSNSPCPTGSSKPPATGLWHSCRESALPVTVVR
jgi:hypothetical protein